MTIELIYWDSDAYLGWLQAEVGKAELCQGTLDRAQDGEVLIVTSALTIAEVLWMKGAPQIPQTKALILRQFFRRSYMRVRNVTRSTSELAQDIVWNNGIKPKDAINVATALDMSSDSRDLRSDSDRKIRNGRCPATYHPQANSAAPVEVSMIEKKPEKPQSERFIETARQLGCDESEERFEAAFRKIVPPVKPAAKPRIRKKPGK